MAIVFIYFKHSEEKFKKIVLSVKYISFTIQHSYKINLNYIGQNAYILVYHKPENDVNCFGNYFMAINLRVNE